MLEREGIVPQDAGSRYSFLTRTAQRRDAVCLRAGAHRSFDRGKACGIRRSSSPHPRECETVATAAAGCLDDAAPVGVYLSDLANFEAIDQIYRTFFEEPLPARTTIQAGLDAVDIEVDAIIALSREDAER